MMQAVRQELAALGLDHTRIEQNAGLAYIAYERLTALPYREELGGVVSTAGALAQPTVVTPTYQGAQRGTASVVALANTPLRKTGNWRLRRPVIDLSRCTQCCICFVSCPDGAIALDDGGNPHIDYDVCKGCLICAEECPTRTIHRVWEAEV
jgi:pyruvate ferredoxin oxidoreductase gamma subunit